MKARVKATGEIVDIADYSTIYLDNYDGSYHINELEFIQDEEKQSIINWKQARVDAAIGAMNVILANREMVAAMLQSPNPRGFEYQVARKSVSFADALIAELKKKGE